MVNIVLDGVWKIYGAFEAVKELNMECGDGEFVSILGPSGCGKSSTLRMLAGLEHISAGEISFGGTVVNRLAPKDRDIAMVFENYALYPHKTVFDNIANPLRRAKIDPAEIERRVKNAAALLEIDQLLDRRPLELSGGQKQRTAIGRAIVREPKVFLFDEPIAHLDAALRAKMRSELKHLQLDLGVTTIYVTHDQLEALSMADRIAVMNEGVLQQFATPAEVYETPANVWVATFVGEPQMSILEMEIQGNGSSLLFEGHEIALSHEKRALLGGYDQSTVLVGSRPDKFAVSREAVPGSIAGEIFAKQLLGSDTLVETQVGRYRVRAKTNQAFPGAIGDPCHITFAPEALLMFSAADGTALKA